MKKPALANCLFVFLFMTAACDSEESQTVESAPPQPEVITNGVILTGNMEGSEFSMPASDELDHFVAMIDDFNRMDVDAVWEHSADTIAMHRPDGTVIPLTREGLAGMFSAADSIEWGVNYAVPAKVEDTNLVKVFADGYEHIYFKDGSVQSNQLFEVFTFEDGKIVEIKQWTAEM